jgi:hypothetical protein
MERHLPGWLSLQNGDLGFTQILTQHYGAQSQAVNQLMSSRTVSNSKFLQLILSGLLKHLRMGLVQILHHTLTTQMELWDFIESSVLYLSVHMELRLRLKFNPVSNNSWNFSQNLEVNCGPLSDTIIFGTPCKQTILAIYNSANFAPV